jgi:Tfp pilus assembly protein PilF
MSLPTPEPSTSQRVAVLFNTAVLLHREGRTAEAQETYTEILRLQPEHAAALLFSAVIALDASEPLRASVLAQRAIDVEPGNAAAHLCLGHALSRRGRAAEALASFDRALALVPDAPGVQLHRGNALKDLRRFERALEAYAAALAAEPAAPIALTNRGNVLAELGKRAEALASYDQAIAAAPDCLDAHVNRASLLGDLGSLAAARAAYDRAIAIDAASAVAHFGRAFLCLLSGDFELGWVDYEWRWRVEDSPTRREVRNFPEPRWQGGVSPAGKTILLHREQGLGDAIQFARYVPLLAAQGASVILEVHEPLRPLLAELTGCSRIIARGDPLPNFDLWCPLLSLPLAFNTRVESIPLPEGYLRADAERVLAWQHRLGPKTRPRVGLVWSGGTTHPNDRNRSVALSALRPHLPPQFEYVCLQDTIRAPDLESLHSGCGAGEPGTIREFCDDLVDFAETAALVECLDLVISVDTSVAHLGGALGKPTWILLPASPDWRWMRDREDSPWYRSVRLFRQSEPDAWTPVFERVEAALTAHFDASAPDMSR